MRGHFTPHTEESRKKCSDAQKLRWKLGFYKNRVLDYTIIAEKTRLKQKKGSFVNCLVCSKNFYCFPSRPRKYCSKKCNGTGKRRENSYQWKGGIDLYPYHHLKRSEYKIWRLEVFKRDNHTCQMCGAKQAFLHPHHIKSYTHFPELRYEVDNGTTLCVDCHKKLHSLLCNIRRWLKSDKSLNYTLFPQGLQ
jgi:5-methylcytosine-specific restriction endonuclease McrA